MLLELHHFWSALQWNSMYTVKLSKCTDISLLKFQINAIYCAAETQPLMELKNTVLAINDCIALSKINWRNITYIYMYIYICIYINKDLLNVSMK